MFPQKDLLPNQYLLPLRMLLKMKTESLEDYPDLIPIYGVNIPIEGKEGGRKRKIIFVDPTVFANLTFT